MKFTKMNGIGNDYIYVYTPEEPDALIDPNGLSVALSNRNYGVGGDGLVLIGKDGDDYTMRIFNADGSEAGMCGNAVRCVAKYLSDRGLSKSKRIKIKTASGYKNVEEISRIKDTVTYKVDMGIPKPINFGYGDIIDYPLPDLGVRITAVDVGNPHAVFFCKDEQAPVYEILKEISLNPMFPNGVNAEAAFIRADGSISVKVWERGSGKTLACGTGACAVLYAARINGLTDNNAIIELPGGSLYIEYEFGRLYMTGSADTNFEGVVKVNGKNQPELQVNEKKLSLF